MKVLNYGQGIILIALSVAGWTQPEPAESVIYTFQGGSDGRAGSGRLIADKEGALYGTTEYGGGSGCSFFKGCGTVFKMTPARDWAMGQTTWTESVVYRFQGGTDGFEPAGELVARRDGALHGMTNYGGSAAEWEYGTVFKLDLYPETRWHDWSRNDNYRDRRNAFLSGESMP